MKIKCAIAVCMLALCSPGLTACDQPVPETSDRDDVTKVSKDDPEMNEARAKAQASLGDFLEMLENPPAGAKGFTFKFPLGGWEHIWVGEVARDGDYLTGRLINEPMQENWALGEPVRVPLKDVSDWAWTDADGVTKGQFTTRVLLGRMPPEKAASIRQSLGWDD